jgi:hypothetical protein
MTFSGEDIRIDSDFSTGSSGPVHLTSRDVYEIGYQPETIPQWFQDLLDNLFDGRGVPKEYMAHVRVHNTGAVTRRITLRFLLSPKGANYMWPPWWIWRGDQGWLTLPRGDTAYHQGTHVDAVFSIAPRETLRIASAPYETPGAIAHNSRQLAEGSDIWTYREIGQTAQGRPIPVLETEKRDLKLLIDASMQSSEPVSWGILHVAHWLTLPTARAQHLRDHIQFCLMPVTNPDGLAMGRSVTNGEGQVPKFRINNLVEGLEAPRETEALWRYLLEQKPDASIEVHAHFTRPDFTRSIGMHDKASMPDSMHEKAALIERALDANYHVAPLKNRKVLIDPRQPEHDVYGDRHISTHAGTIRTFLQSVPDSIPAHCADVQEMTETVALALMDWLKKRRA